jgi:hypothetical protein
MTILMSSVVFFGFTRLARAKEIRMILVIAGLRRDGEIMFAVFGLFNAVTALAKLGSFCQEHGHDFVDVAARTVPTWSEVPSAGMECERELKMWSGVR